MRRLWNTIAFIVMIVAATLAGFMATDQTLTSQPKGIALLGNGAVMTLVGLFAGLALAWGWRVNWRAIPMHIRYWLVLQRRRFWWTTTAVTSVGILLFY